MDLGGDLTVSLLLENFHLSAMLLLVAGAETTRNVAADVSSFVIDGLQSDSAYSVLVSALSGSREGSPATLTIRTGTTLNLSNAHFCCCPENIEKKLVYEQGNTKYSNWDYVNKECLKHVNCLYWQSQISLWSGR